MLGYNVARSVADDTLFQVYNDAISTALRLSLDHEGRLSVKDGTVAKPSLRFIDDLDTGLYRISANNIGVAVNGAKVLDISATGLAITGNLSFTGTGPSSKYMIGHWSHTTAISDPDTQTDTSMTFLANSSNAVSVMVPTACSLTTITIKLGQSSRDAGTLTCQATRNDAPIGGAVAVIDGTNTVQHSAIFSVGTHAFAAGDRLGFIFSTVGFSKADGSIGGTLFRASAEMTV